MRYDEFKVSPDGMLTTEVEVGAPEAVNEGHYEHFVGVKRIKAVDGHNGVKERGFFGNQNIVAKPRDPKWNFTVERLKTLWRVT